MAFIRKKKFGNREYYYLVEAKREGKKVRQKVLRYLGAEKPSPDEVDRIIKEIKGGKG